MKANDLERWMKEKIRETPCLPTEAGWEKLHSALQETTPKRETKLQVLIAPAWNKIAASLALLIAVATTWLYQPTNNSMAPSTSRKQAADHRYPPQPNRTQEENKPVLLAAVEKPNRKKAKPTIAAKSKEWIENSEETFVANPPGEEPNTQEKGGRKMPAKYSDPAALYPDPQEIETIRPPGTEKNLKLGVAAQMSSSSVGRAQYQLGVVAYKNLSRRVFTQAALVVASTDVRYTQENIFSTVRTGSLSSTSADQKTIDANYQQNIISVGFTPRIGYWLTRHFAVSCGVAVYRNLDQQLQLKNENSIDAAALDNDIISSTKSINEWDFGISGGVSYKAGSRLSMELQYRQGVSGYIQLDGKAIRNSGLGVGLSYLLGR